MRASAIILQVFFFVPVAVALFVISASCLQPMHAYPDLPTATLSGLASCGFAVAGGLALVAAALVDVAAALIDRGKIPSGPPKDK
jgi:hypothetical protein